MKYIVAFVGCLLLQLAAFHTELPAASAASQPASQQQNNAQQKAEQPEDLGQLVAMPAALTEFGKRELNMHVPEKMYERGRSLLVWCHPSDGNPVPGFKFWMASRLFNQHTILLCPKAGNIRWNPKVDARYMDALIKHVVETYEVDEDRIILGGHSNGGMFTYSYGMQRQKTFAALLPAAAFAQHGIPRKDKKSDMTVAIYHSRNDQVIAWDYMEKTAAQLKKRGFAFDITEDKIQHNIGPKLFDRFKRLRNEVIVADGGQAIADNKSKKNKKKNKKKKKDKQQK